MLKKKRSPRPKKPRKQYSERTRLLCRDFGRSNDVKYYTLSVQANKLAVNYGITYNNPDWCRAQYLSAENLRTTAVQACDWVGNEKIFSTFGLPNQFNNVTHLKTRAKNLPYFHLSEQYNSSSLMNCVYYWRSPVPTSIRTDVGSLALGNGFGQVGMDQMFSARAYWSMRPKFEGDVSIINSIFELKDFKDVVNLSHQLKGIRNAAKVLREYSEYVVKAKKKRLAAISPTSVSDNLALDITGTVANAQLTYSLAIMPTIMDYLAITAQLLTDVHEKQKIFSEYGERGTTSHFSERTTQSFASSNPNNGYAYATGLILQSKRTATARFKYSYIMRDRNEALRKYWGLTGTAEQLWNMLPLSFVVDYFLGVGKALSYMSWDEHVTDLKIEYCESIRTVAGSGYHLLLSPRTPCVIVDGVVQKISSQSRSLLVSGFEGTFYERKVMEPYKGMVLPKLRLPTRNQTANLLALARSFLF